MQEKTLEEELKKISKELYGDEYKLGRDEYNVLYTSLEKAREEGRKEGYYEGEKNEFHNQTGRVMEAITQYKEELLVKIKNSPDTFGITDKEGRGGAILIRDIEKLL